MPELIRKSQDGTREIFEPIVAQCSRASQYNGANPPDKHKFAFDGLRDSINGTIYWQVARDQAPPVVGNWYTVTLSINTSPTGTKYHDIMLLEPTGQVAVEQQEVAAALNLMGKVSQMNAEADYAPTATQPGLSAPESPNAGIVVEGVVQGHLEKLAVDLYILHAPLRNQGDDPDYVRIREIRDALYHQVKQKPIQHARYCHQHETSFQFGNTGYGHRLETDDGWCIQETGIIMDDIYVKEE